MLYETRGFNALLNALSGYQSLLLYLSPLHNFPFIHIYENPEYLISASFSESQENNTGFYILQIIHYFNRK